MSSSVPTQATGERSALQKIEAFLIEISFQSTKTPQKNKHSYLPFSGKLLLLSSEKYLFFCSKEEKVEKKKRR